ncbi:MAG: methionine adenosyltransferase [Deltaproteobacteria bacterium]|nr:methionine adenosyltransferase [Deltaproteobacteria bacterium]
MSGYLFTSESVTEGHPDKVCDAVSDAILDSILEVDPTARVACETLTKTGVVFIAGEITTNTYVHFPDIVRQTVKDIGYTESAMGFDYETCSVISAIEQQSGDIAMGVDGHGYYEHDEQGAGDQGMMFGYASDETPELMPLPIMTAHKLAARLAAVRKEGLLPFLRPDGKTQVSVRYENGMPKEITTVVVSSQHSPDVSHSQLEEGIIQEVVNKVIPSDLMAKDIKFLINPTGRFVIGGPMADSGLTGRKIIVDTYGGMAAHGGGAFSGKDPSKVDRSASYMARYIAKNLVAAGFAKKCQVQLAYAIGVATPVSLMVDTYGTGKVSDEAIQKVVKEVFDCRPGAIVRNLDLLKPRYRITSSYGHFGRTEPSFTWEKTDKVDELKSKL